MRHPYTRPSKQEVDSLRQGYWARTVLGGNGGQLLWGAPACCLRVDEDGGGNLYLCGRCWPQVVGRGGGEVGELGVGGSRQSGLTSEENKYGLGWVCWPL